MPNWPFTARGRLQSARALVERLAGVLQSRISVELWDGTVLPLGPEADPKVRLAVHSPGVLSSLLHRPTLDNLTHHYAAGQLALIGADPIRFIEMARGQGTKAAWKGIGKFWALGKLLPFILYPGDRSRVGHVIADAADRAPIQRNYKEVIKFHYDLGNEFYELFLDPEMVYSCGYFTDWNNSLAQAQVDKLEMICRKLRLQPGETLLDIGCGWGGLLCHAAQNFGVRGHGVTLSAEQLAFAQAKVRRLGLEDRITLEFKDFNDLKGPFDKIASVGMMEHVGLGNYDNYFRKLYSLLSDRGLLLNHAIMRGAKKTRRRFLHARPEHHFVKKYIFPGGELDSIGHTLEVMERNNFLIHDVEGWREHYALTLKFWCENLAARRAEAEQLVGPEVTRLWLAYLAGFHFCFQKGSLRLFQTLACKRASRDNPILPLTREDLYQRPFPSAVPTAKRAA